MVLDSGTTLILSLVRGILLRHFLVPSKIGASATSVNCFIDWDAGDGWWANGIFYCKLSLASHIQM